MRNQCLRIPDSYGAKIAKNCNLWTFWPVIQLQAIMSRDSRFLLFQHHNYQVSLRLSTLRFRDQADTMKEGIPIPKVFVPPLFTYRGRDYLHINKLIVSGLGTQKMKFESSMHCQNKLVPNSGFYPQPLAWVLQMSILRPLQISACRL